MPAHHHQRLDACPGVLTVHQAADGGVARIRVPGGQLPAAAFRAVVAAAAELGDGTIELTSRANLQVRGLTGGAEAALAARLAVVGLLPSESHERVRNIIASPLTGRAGGGLADVRPLVAELDRKLCADPQLAELPARFLFAIDDGRGDVAWSGADAAALLVAPPTSPAHVTAAILLGGVDSGLRGEPVPLLLACARAFLALRTGEWRIAELPDGPRRLAAHIGRPTAAHLPTQLPVTHGPLGRIEQVDGRVALVAGAPLGRLGPAHAAALAGAPLVITPWRSVVAADLATGDLAKRLRATGLLLDPDDPRARVTACVGRPGCASALADVRADAAPMPESALPVHWSGCARRCGRPRGEVIDVVATGDGYTVTRGDR